MEKRSEGGSQIKGKRKKHNTKKSIWWYHHICTLLWSYIYIVCVKYKITLKKKHKVNNDLYFTSTEASLKHRILAFKNDSFCSALILCVNRRNTLVGNKPWFLQDAGRTEAQQRFSSSTASEQENLLQNRDASSEAPPIISRLESLRAHARLGAGVQTGRGGTSRQAPATDSPPTANYPRGL